MEVLLFWILFAVIPWYLYHMVFKKQKPYYIKPRKYFDKKYTPIKNPKSYMTNKEKGDKYELQILKYYKNQGYKVYPQGFIKGKSDNGIDLIAYKDNEALLIQCKNWEYSQVKQEQLRIFLGDCTAYLEQNHKIFAKKNVKRIFITSSKNIDYGVKKFLQTSNIEYKIIPYEQ